LDLLPLQQLLVENGLRLIIRSYEGPDARTRSEMPHMLAGWSLDHDVQSGRVITVFGFPIFPPPCLAKHRR